jgi:FOG: Transposase and inactivated derivatives
VFQQLLEKCQQVVASAPGKKKRKFRFKNRLLSLDATVIALCVSAFDWAQFRRTKGAVKLHLLLDHDGHLPSFAVVTEGKLHEVQVARQLHFAPGTILAIDRGYTDYEWFARLSEEKVYFVTRLKDNADYAVVEEREIPQRKGVRRDQVIFFYKLARAGVECFFRRVEYYDEKTDALLVFLTNHLSLAAATVAAVYKERWAIELFFKALKQNLRVKTFIGTSENALQIQIWTALIALLLIKYLQLRATFGWSLSNLVSLLRQQLFVYRDLWAWIDNPFQPPLLVTPALEQLPLGLG